MVAGERLGLRKDPIGDHGQSFDPLEVIEVRSQDRQIPIEGSSRDPHVRTADFAALPPKIGIKIRRAKHFLVTRCNDIKADQELIQFFPFNTPKSGFSGKLKKNRQGEAGIDKIGFQIDQPLRLFPQPPKIDQNRGVCDQ